MRRVGRVRRVRRGVVSEEREEGEVYPPPSLTLTHTQRASRVSEGKRRRNVSVSI